MATEEKKVKGRPLLGYSKYIKKKWGKEGLDSCEKAVGYKFSDIKEEAWYPSYFSDDISAWTAETHGMEEVRKSGQAMVTEVGIISYFAKMAGLQKVLDRAMEESMEQLNHGKLDVHKEPNKATVKLHDLTPRREVCEAWQGILEGVLILTRTKGQVEKVSCELNGDEACTYVMAWEK